MPEEAKRELEEIKRRVLELRSRIEKWAMIKIADVGEMNAVYRELGVIARKLAQFNPNPEAVRLKAEVESLMRRVEELRARTPVTTIPTARPTIPPTPPSPARPATLAPRRPEVTIPVTGPAKLPVVPSPPSPPPPVVKSKVPVSTAVGPQTPKPETTTGSKSPGNPARRLVRSTGPCGWGFEVINTSEL